MTTTGRTGARNYRDRKDLSSDSESSFEAITSSAKIMSDKSLSPSRKRQNRSRSTSRDHYRRKRSYSPRDRSSSPIRKAPHRSVDRYQGHQQYDGGRRPYGRFGSHRPYFDRGQGRPMRRPFRGFVGRNFRYNNRYQDHGQQGGQYYKERSYQPPGYNSGDRGRRRSQSRSISRSRSRSRSLSRRRSFSPDHKRRVSRSPSPLVSSTAPPRMPKTSTYKGKDLKGHDSDKYAKRVKDDDRPEKVRRSSSKDGRSKSPENLSSSSRRAGDADTKLPYRREDLEKITIDIHRNVKEQSPTLRRIVNPEEVKLVRRVNEGNRPLFEREEIQNPAEDLREEISERRIISVKGNQDERKDAKSLGSSGLDVRDYAQTEGSSRIPLSKRWQQAEGGASSSTYTHVPMVHSSITRRSYSEERDPSPAYERSRALSPVASGAYPRTSSAADPDPYRETSLERYDRHYPADPSDLRHSLSSRRKDDSYEDTRRKFHDRPDYHGSDLSSSSRRRFKGELDRSPSPVTSLDLQLRGRSEERLPDFSQRPDRFKYNAWTDKPEVIPKGPSYYEHDDRDRGGNRPFRSRGFRPNRFFRPRGYRTGFQSRGTFVPRGVGGQSIRRPFRSGTGYIPRSRGYIPR